LTRQAIKNRETTGACQVNTTKRGEILIRQDMRPEELEDRYFMGAPHDKVSVSCPCTVNLTGQ